MRGDDAQIYLDLGNVEGRNGPIPLMVVFRWLPYLHQMQLLPVSAPFTFSFHLRASPGAELSSFLAYPSFYFSLSLCHTIVSLTVTQNPSYTNNPTFFNKTEKIERNEKFEYTTMKSSTKRVSPCCLKKHARLLSDIET